MATLQWIYLIWAKILGSMYRQFHNQYNYDIKRIVHKEAKSKDQVKQLQYGRPFGSAVDKTSAEFHSDSNINAQLLTRHQDNLRFIDEVFYRVINPISLKFVLSGLNNKI